MILNIARCPEKCLKMTLVFSLVIHLSFLIKLHTRAGVEEQVVLKSKKSNMTLINVVMLDNWERVEPVKKKKSSAGEIPRLLDKKKKIIIKRHEKVQESLSKEAMEVRESYITKVLQQIHRRKYYPAIARRMHLEGDVKLKFTLDKSGKILGTASVLNGCDHDVLNRAGVSTVEKAGPFPVFPKEIAAKKSSMTFVVTVDYSLKYQ